MICKCRIGPLHGWFIKVRFHNGGFQVIDLHGLGNPSKVPECLGMAPDEGLYALIQSN